MDDLLQRLPNWIDPHRFDSFQRSIVEEVVGAFNDGYSLVCLDAPTGSGKSAIAEAIRLSLDTRSTVLTHSLVLQDQLAHDFADRIEVIKGKRNYAPTDAEPDRWGVTPTCADCDYDQETKLCTYCPEGRATCPYVIAKQRASEADVLCANYAYFFGEVLGRGSICRRDFIVADEADTLEDELLRHVSIDISPRVQKFLGLRPPKHKTKETFWPEWFEYALPVVGQKIRQLSPTDLREKRQKRSLEDLHDKMRMVSKDLEGWLYDGYQRGWLSWKPIRVDKLAPGALWKHGKQWLAMSATIVSPEEFVDSLGYEGSWYPVFAPSTFPKERRPINYVPVASMTKKTEEKSRPLMAAGLLAVLDRHPDERVLVHTHSYANTEFWYEQIRPHVDRQIFRYMNSSEREDAITKFETFDGSVLLAPSLERGYDGADDKVRVVVIAKIAYPYLGDRQVSARLYSSGGSLWYATLTARQIIQAMGRGMRHENDSMTGYLLDEQFATFYEKWAANGSQNGSSSGRAHRLFPQWFLEALEWHSDARHELRREISVKRKELLGKVV